MVMKLHQKIAELTTLTADLQRTNDGLAPRIQVLSNQNQEILQNRLEQQASTVVTEESPPQIAQRTQQARPDTLSQLFSFNPPQTVEIPSRSLSEPAATQHVMDMLTALSQQQQQAFLQNDRFGNVLPFSSHDNSATAAVLHRPHPSHHSPQQQQVSDAFLRAPLAASIERTKGTT
jgi:hypothetical protein